MRIKTKIIAVLITALIILSILPLYAQQKASSFLTEFKVPENYGSVKEMWTPNIDSAVENQPMVIYIQDAHCNYEAQKNISGIINELMDKYPDKINFVAVEGSVGVVDTSPLSSFADKNIKSEVADYFMRKGKVTGPEFLSITGDRIFTIYGIDDKELYDKNHKTLINSVRFSGEAEIYCEYMENILTRLKQALYTPEAEEFDGKLQSYHKGLINLSDYVDILKGWSSKGKISLNVYKNFNLFVKVQDIEKKIDFAAADRERTDLVNKLGNLLGKEDLSMISSKSMEFKYGTLTAVEYYDYLKTIVEKFPKDIPHEDYSNLFSYIDYIKVYYRIETMRLFDELAHIENAIAKKIFNDEDQKKLFTISRDLGILRRMFKLELLKEEYQYYKENKASFNISEISNFIKQISSRFGIAYDEAPSGLNIDSGLPIVEEFYETAIKRDSALIDNMLREMKNRKANISILIAGGFHTKGLVSILKERKIAHLVVTPKITQKQGYSPYLDIMTNKMTLIEEFLERLGNEEK